MGVSMRAGAPKPDISSVDAFKRALLNAKSVIYVPESVIGIHLARVFECLSIAEQMKAKTKTKPRQGTEGLAQAVADGEAELGFALTNELLSFSGVELIGPFPPELQSYNSFIAGVSTAAEQQEAAKALIKFLTTPARCRGDQGKRPGACHNVMVISSLDCIVGPNRTVVPDAPEAQCFHWPPCSARRTSSYNTPL